VKKFNFFFNGEELPASKGDSVAAALLNSGKNIFGERMNGKHRGLYCGMGVCNECLVTINGERGIRACMQYLEPNAVVEKEIDTKMNVSEKKSRTFRKNKFKN
jgi:aerobic-type carbon monoxide dehydrogenase small subunit (CoxS/CutS family)